MTVEGDKVFLVTDPALLEKSARASCPSGKKSGGAGQTTVIVGGGGAGMVAAETLRAEGYEGRIVMLSRETNYPIDRIKLSKGFSGDVARIQLRDEA